MTQCRNCAESIAGANPEHSVSCYVSKEDYSSHPGLTQINDLRLEQADKLTLVPTEAVTPDGLLFLEDPFFIPFNTQTIETKDQSLERYGRLELYQRAGPLPFYLCLFEQRR